MLSALKRALTCTLLLLMMGGGCLNAEAASSRIVVKMNSGSVIGPVLTLLNATVLDTISDANLYLLQVPLVPSLSPLTLNLLGIAYIETDTTLYGPTHETLGILKSK